MPRGPANFRQRDLVAALKAVKKAGCDGARVAIEPDGRIVVSTLTAAETAAANARTGEHDEVNEWDAVGRPAPHLN